MWKRNSFKIEISAPLYEIRTPATETVTAPVVVEKTGLPESPEKLRQLEQELESMRETMRQYSVLRQSLASCLDEKQKLAETISQLRHGSEEKILEESPYIVKGGEAEYVAVKENILDPSGKPALQNGKPLLYQP